MADEIFCQNLRDDANYTRWPDPPPPSLSPPSVDPPLDVTPKTPQKKITRKQPENVFVGEDGCLKIGDFGLSRSEAAIAAGLATDHEPPATTTAATSGPDPREAAIVPRRWNSPKTDKQQQSSGCYTTGVGTASYASPEQLQGRRYSVRSDLFSLGLLLLELCCCFTTTHERSDAFQSMRRPDGSTPPRLAERSPAVARLAELLCRTVPEQRPSAAEMLEMLDDLDSRCGCEGCPGGIDGVGERRGGRSGSGEIGGSSSGGGYAEGLVLREELAAKTRKVEEQVILVGRCNVLFASGCVVYVRNF